MLCFVLPETIVQGVYKDQGIYGGIQVVFPKVLPKTCLRDAHHVCDIYSASCYALQQYISNPQPISQEQRAEACYPLWIVCWDFSLHYTPFRKKSSHSTRPPIAALPCAANTGVGKWRITDELARGGKNAYLDLKTPC
jgi:hypothetical protein